MWKKRNLLYDYIYMIHLEKDYLKKQNINGCLMMGMAMKSECKSAWRILGVGVGKALKLDLIKVA